MKMASERGISLIARGKPLFVNNVFPSPYGPLANLVDMGGTGAGAQKSEGVLLFRNSAHSSLLANARNLGQNSAIQVTPLDGLSPAPIRLRFSDDNENQRSITNAQDFATSPAVE